MTTTETSCSSFSERLMAYLEQETDDATRTTLERHALSCGECGALLADLRKLRIDAANLPELAPSRDLWAGIATRIEAPVVPIGAVRRAVADQPRVTRRWLRGALLAASLMAAAGVGYVVAKGTRVEANAPRIADIASDSGQRVALLPPDSAVVVAPSRETSRAEPRAAAPAADRAVTSPPRPPAEQLALATLTADYDREVARLRVLIEQRRNQLDPVTVAIIERNLLVIDAAIMECQKAVAADPASRFLVESLNRSLQAKVELMRTAALLPART